MGSFSKSEIQTFIKQFQINLLISVTTKLQIARMISLHLLENGFHYDKLDILDREARFDIPIDLPKEKLQHLCSRGSVWVGAQKQDTQHVVT